MTSAQMTAGPPTAGCGARHRESRLLSAQGGRNYITALHLGLVNVCNHRKGILTVTAIWRYGEIGRETAQEKAAKA